MNILVIEDEPDIRKNLEYNLSREGFKVSTAGSLKDGLKSLDSNTYSLILLDLNLPRKNGLEVLDYISGEKDHTLDSVIMISGEFDERGLLCKFSLTEKESKNVIMFLVTFNGDKSTYNFLQRNEETGKLESHIQIYKFISKAGEREILHEEGKRVYIHIDMYIRSRCLSALNTFSNTRLLIQNRDRMTES